MGTLVVKQVEVMWCAVKVC